MALSAEVNRAINAAVNRTSERVAEKTVQQTLLALGIDVSNPTAVVEFQRDQAYTRKTRVFAEARSTKYALAGIGLAFTVLGGALAAWVKKIMGW